MEHQHDQDHLESEDDDDEEYDNYDDDIEANLQDLLSAGSSLHDVFQLSTVQEENSSNLLEMSQVMMEEETAEQHQPSNDDDDLLMMSQDATLPSIARDPSNDYAADDEHNPGSPVEEELGSHHPYHHHLNHDNHHLHHHPHLGRQARDPLLMDDKSATEYSEAMTNNMDHSNASNDDDRQFMRGNSLADLFANDNNNGNGNDASNDNNNNGSGRPWNRRASFVGGLYRRGGGRDVKSKHSLDSNGGGSAHHRKESGQHVAIRTGPANAMDEKERRRQRWKNKWSNLINFGKGSDDEKDNDLDRIGGAKISMHGRLMVQPSRRHLNIPPTGSGDGNGEFGANGTNGQNLEELEEEEAAERRREQTLYTLTTVKGKQSKKFTVQGMYEDLTKGEGDTIDKCCCCFLCCPSGFNSERAMASFLHWAFRSPFVVVFGSAAIGWLAMTVVFAIVIWILGVLQPDCIGGVDYALSPARFMDAYALSWTTFSTVGYGLIYPAVHTPRIKQCTPITMLTTFESFVGVLFSSLCAALMFAKVARVQSFAQVTFSDPIVIRYGEGLRGEGDDDEEDEDGNSSNGGKDKGKKISSEYRIPCPVLEFRIFNRMDSIPGGEIIDATLNMVAVLDPSQADMGLAGKRGRRKRGKKKRGPTRQKQTASMRFLDVEDEDEDDNDDNDNTEQATESIRSQASSESHASPPEKSPLSLPKPPAVQFQQSVTQRGAPVPLRGPAPSLIRRTPNNDADTDTQRAMNPLHHQQQSLTPPHLSAAKSWGHQQPSVTPPQLAATKSWGQRPGTIRRTRQTHSSIRDSSASVGRHSIINRINSLGFRGARHRNDSANSASSGIQPNLNRVSTRNRTMQAFDEDPTGKLQAKQMLVKLDLESPDHPFFRRIWLVRHTLDINSLLLKPHVRLMLRKNHGYWPKELNNYESIRASIEFNQILVSLSGTSNADANSVYAQHVYNMVDMSIGYRFVNALYRDPNDGGLRVDQSLINDVMEQAGGGGEPLQEFDEGNFNELLVL